jgi:hypothetical protein
MLPQKLQEILGKMCTIRDQTKLQELLPQKSTSKFNRIFKPKSGQYATQTSNKWYAVSSIYQLSQDVMPQRTS